MASSLFTSFMAKCLTSSIFEKNLASVSFSSCKLSLKNQNYKAVRFASTASGHISGASESRFLEGRKALVTGSTSGIGLSTARALAARGCQVLLNGFGEEQMIKSLQAEFSEHYKTKADYIPVDLSNQEEVITYVQQVKKLYPDGIDILVNNAGIQHVSPVEEFSLERWNALVAVLLTAPFQLIHAFIGNMQRQKWGRIINVGSVHSVRASPFKAGYVSAKHGLAGLTKVIALETAGSGVTCNTLCPGFVDTPLIQPQVHAFAERENLPFEEARPKFFGQYHPSKEPVTQQQLAEMVVFICTEAADQVTGFNVVMDGGWTAK